MKKISLIITAALLTLASNLTLAQESNSFSNGKWSAKFGASLESDISFLGESVDLDDKGFSIGADYEIELDQFSVVLGGYNIMGREYKDQDGDTIKFSGLVLTANIKKHISDKLYAFGGLNIGQAKLKDWVTFKQDGINYQIGVGYAVNEKLGLVLVKEELTFDFSGLLEVDNSSTTLYLSYAL